MNGMNSESKQILVVEDNPVVLRLVTEILHKNGYNPETAEDGLSALNQLDAFTPDIIFVDLLIPKIDGETLCTIIQNRAELNDSYVIILSGIAHEAGIDFERLGADACIAKGKNIRLHIETVLEKIEKNTLLREPKKIYGYDEIYPREATVGLLRSKDHLKVILENLTDGLVEITHDGSTIFVNPAAEKLLSTSSCQILGKNLFASFDTGIRNYPKSLFEGAKRGQKQVDESDPISLNNRYVTLKIFPLSTFPNQSYIILIHDITERKALNDRLKSLSKTDQLTGIYNRRAFNDVLEKAIQEATIHKESFSLLLIDIDHFKQYNDSFGHQVGDKLLKQIVGVITLQIRKIDTLFRWGGDELALLLPKTESGDLLYISERIRSAVEREKFDVPENITISVGGCAYEYGDNESSILDRADVALYQAKNNGRNCVCLK